MTTTLTRNTARAAGSAREKRTRRARFLRRAVLLASVVAVAGALVYAWRPRPLEVDLATATKGELFVTLDESGRTRVRDRYVVSAPIAGNMLRVAHRPGAAVKRDETVAQIIPLAPMLLDARSKSEAGARVLAAGAARRQAQVAIARATVASAHATEELERVRTLVGAGSLAPSSLRVAELDARLRAEELASAQFAEQMARHEEAMATAALRRFDPKEVGGDAFDLTSPAAGVVLRVMRESATPVSAGTPVLELGDPSALEVVSEVLTADAVGIKPGARVTVTRWGGADLAAHVRVVEPSAFTRLSALGVEEQRVATLIDFDAPREQWTSLGDGYRVEVRIVLAERHDVIRAPLSAVFRHEDGWATYVVREGRAQLLPVRVGARGEALVEVEAGLAAGDLLILHPSERVTPGTRVVRRD